MRLDALQAIPNINWPYYPATQVQTLAPDYKLAHQPLQYCPLSNSYSTMTWEQQQQHSKAMDPAST
jgi:hypothetical protein